MGISTERRLIDIGRAARHHIPTFKAANLVAFLHLAPAYTNQPQTPPSEKWKRRELSQKQQIHAQANWQGETMRMDKYSSGSSYWFGGITTMLGALSLNEWALVIGIACTVGTFGVNWYYKRKEYQLRERSNVPSSPQ